MRKFRAVFLLLVIAATTWYSTYELLKGPCDLPRSYRVGAFDERFGISQATFIIALQSAEKIWEDALGIDLFTYDQNNGLPINLIYDERQAVSNNNKVLESRIEITEKSAETIKREFESLKRRHEISQKEYVSMKSAYEAQQSEYNAQISYWNSKGGAPEAQYKALLDERSALESSYRALEAKRSEVNALSQQINALVGEYNKLVRVVNSNVEVINESADKEFEQGEYVRKDGEEKVDIYVFDDREDLVRVIAHEFGHVLDSDHNENPDSIMYYLNSSENMKPTIEDIAGIRASCKID